MKVLCNELDLGAFFAGLVRARERLLMLDYDGTLAPFHVDPRLALPYPQVCTILRRIAEDRRTRIVIVSGRRLADLRAPLAMLPHHEVWASHGWERRGGAGPDREAPAPRIRESLGHAREIVQLLLAPGVRLETKVASLAVHWRGLPAHEASRVHAAATEAW
jgi:trehalose-phosphatase